MGRGAGEQWPRGRWGPTTLPGRFRLRDLEGRLELRVSRTFLDQLRPQLFRPWIPSSARDIDGGPRRFTEVVLNEQWINGFSTNIIHAIIWPSAL